jgi:hypothetical protein
MFAAQLTSGDYTLSLNSTTYDTNSGTSLGAVAYILAPSS